jgi:hypothetical protein
MLSFAIDSIIERQTVLADGGQMTAS